MTLSRRGIWRGMILAAIAVVTLGSALAADGKPFVSALFGDHMVLQRGKPNRVWGWTTPGAVVAVEIAGKRAEAKAADDGKWLATFEPPAAQGPFEMKISVGGGALERTLHNVMVGDVWLCGGQSNMEFTLRGAKGGAELAKTADDPGLRVFTVAHHVAYAPETDVRGEWKVCTPETAPGISAVAYYFARELREKVKVPIGLVVDCVGGSPAEAWMSAEGLARVGDFDARLKEIARLHAKGVKEHGSFLMHWLDEYDAGEAWAAPEFDDHAWKTVDLKGGFEELGVGETPAVVWFRREIVVPEGAKVEGAKVMLGAVYKMDTTYVNGRWVGESSWSENPRVYPVRAGVLKPGKNLIALRVFKLKSGAAFAAKAEDLRIELSDGTKIPLAEAKWRAAVSVDARPPHVLPLDFENYATMPEVFYDGMIAPVAPLAITGALWYQGEANTTRPRQYARLLPALIADWREKFQQGEFPFLIVQLPAFMDRKTEPGTDGWAELREAQAKTAATVPNTGIAITIDTGDAKNIHPIDKRPVGERLARVALAQHYGATVVDQGPTLRKAKAAGALFELRFDHADGGLAARGGGSELKGFAIAGADHVWHWAEAGIIGVDLVVVRSEAVKAPVAVRYAWQGNPEATLFNGEGLPAGPFRTDDWPLTEEQ